MHLYNYDSGTLREMLAEADAVDAAIGEAVREALLLHKALGNPIATWENGRVVWIAPEDIAIYPPANDAPERE